MATVGIKGLNCSATGGDAVHKSETRLYVCQTHDKFHTRIKHSITPWNRTVCFYSQDPKY